MDLHAREVLLSRAEGRELAPNFSRIATHLQVMMGLGNEPDGCVLS
jgi:hypothetical protein